MTAIKNKEMIKISLKWGIILGLTISIGTQVLTWLGLGLTNWYVAITYVAVIVMTFLAAKNQIKALGSKFTYLKALMSVLVIIIVSRYIFQFYMYIYISYIEPTWVDTVSDMWTKMMHDQNVETEVLQKRISSFRKAWQPLNIFTVEIVYIGLSQFILGSIVTSVYKWISSRRKS